MAALVVLLAATPGQGALLLDGAPGIRVLPASEVLSGYTVADSQGGMLFRGGDGELVPFVLSTDNPEIRNPGDGAFHPVDPNIALQALSALPPRFLEPLEVDLFLLPYPRSGNLSSSAGDRAIYLSPGVREYSARQVHFLVAHEMGHQVHRRWLPDEDAAAWTRYRELRGITGDDRFQDDAPHAYRPHEIFAEDFRVLLGGRLAAGDGNVENRELRPPGDVPGLVEFFRGLIGEGAMPDLAALRVVPNPVLGGQEFGLAGAPAELAAGSRGEAMVIDVVGRTVGRLGTTVLDGRRVLISDQAGVMESLPAGAYWIRLLGPRVRAEAPVRIVR